MRTAEGKARRAMKRAMLRYYASMSGDERVARAARLIEESWKHMSEEGKRLFIARNFRMRRIKRPNE